MSFGGFIAQFSADRSFTLKGDGWPTFNGSWTTHSAEIELVVPNGADGCSGAGRYQFRVDGLRMTFDLVSDAWSRAG